MTATVHMLPVKHNRQNVVYLPDPALVTGEVTKKLAVARDIAGQVQLGQPLSLPAILTALEALESHGKGKRDADLALVLEAAAVTLRRAARDETPMEVIMQHRDQWGLIMAYGLAGAAMLLAATGWL